MMRIFSEEWQLRKLYHNALLFVYTLSIRYTYSQMKVSFCDGDPKWWLKPLSKKKQKQLLQWK